MQTEIGGMLRASRIILATGLVAVFIIGLVWFVPTLVNPQYFGLRHKSAKYYADFTAACDSILTEHPLGTNEAVKIALTDPPLPKIITDLHPIRIQVRPQCVWLLLGSDSHAGFGLAWEPQYGQTNIWVLHTIAESLDTVIYTSKR
jgi:hypothetical protein